ncbi:Serine protease AprX [Clostridiales bacterium CHKCI001]|nr:Serine protease AprX [Clostridiales bacterium CHKCI001]
MLIIDGNAVYEMDEECMRKHHISRQQLYNNVGIEEEKNHYTKIVRKARYTGEGITVAILDTGIYPHPDFGNRIVVFKDFVYGKRYPYDKNGHGTHVAGKNLFTK